MYRVTLKTLIFIVFFGPLYSIQAQAHNDRDRYMKAIATVASKAVSKAEKDLETNGLQGFKHIDSRHLKVVCYILKSFKEPYLPNLKDAVTIIVSKKHKCRTSIKSKRIAYFIFFKASIWADNADKVIEKIRKKTKNTKRNRVNSEIELAARINVAENICDINFGNRLIQHITKAASELNINIGKAAELADARHKKIVHYLNRTKRLDQFCANARAGKI